MSLEQTIKDTLLAESVDLDMRLQQLVRAGLMPANTIPLLRKGIAKVQGGYPLVGAERDVMANFLNAMMFIVLGDDTIFNKARTGAKHYATEEIDKDLEDELKKTRQTKKSVEDAKEKYGIKEGENKEMKDKDPCWKGYEMVGMKKKGGRQVPNCVPANEEVEQIDERDEGKPGKNFAKIAANAAKKYGSKEAGNRVAGAIRKKILAKEEAEQIDEISKGKAMKALQHAASDMDDHRGYTLQKKINKKWPEMKDHTGRAAYTSAFGRPEKVHGQERDKLADRAKTSYRMTKSGKANKQDLKARFRKEEAMADIIAITQMNESYRSTFNAALTQYGIKSPSELDEEKRKEFFNFVDQNYKKGDN